MVCLMLSKIAAHLFSSAWSAQVAPFLPSKISLPKREHLRTVSRNVNQCSHHRKQ